MTSIALSRWHAGVTPDAEEQDNLNNRQRRSARFATSYEGGRPPSRSRALTDERVVVPGNSG